MVYSLGKKYKTVVKNRRDLRLRKDASLDGGSGKRSDACFVEQKLNQRPYRPCV